MRQADGSWTGISVDLWREIASDLKIDFELKEIPVADRFNALMNGWIDVCIGPITVTAEREEQIDFTHRFFTSGLRVAMRAKDAAPQSQTGIDTRTTRDSRPKTTRRFFHSKFPADLCKTDVR
jgi:ABC-type amino acid transport substrate-binding protein